MGIKKKSVMFILSLAVFAGCTLLLFAENIKENRMSYVGRWVFHSIMSMDENGGSKFLDAEEYLNEIPDYIDQNDADAVAHELKEKKMMISSQLEICEDGMMYTLTPIPEGVSQKEIDAAVAAGEVSFRHGMLVLEQPKPWEIRNGELWVPIGMVDFYDGQGKRQNWEKCTLEDGLLTVLTIRYKKAE